MRKNLSAAQLIIIGNLASIVSRLWVSGFILELVSIITLTVGYYQYLELKKQSKVISVVGGIVLWLINAGIIGAIFS